MTDAQRFGIRDCDGELIHTTETRAEAESAKEYLSTETPWGRPYTIEPAQLADELELLVERWYEKADKMRAEGYGADYHATRSCADELAKIIEEDLPTVRKD